MLRAKLVCSTGRMERISEEDETLNIGAASSNLGSDPATQRFAANHQVVTADLFGPNSLDDGPETCLERIVRVRNASALLRVQKIEPDDVDSARREPNRKSRYEITVLIGASAVPQNHRDINLVLVGRSVHERSHFLIPGNLDA
jgi:hypothetical protein